MSLDATINKLNQDNEDIARLRRDLRNQQIQIVAGTVGFVLGAAAAVTYKIMSNRK